MFHDITSASVLLFDTAVCFSQAHEIEICMRMTFRPFVKKTPLVCERFYLPFAFSPSASRFAPCQGLLPPTFDTATWCLGGGDAYSCNAWHCWFHWQFLLLSSVLNHGVKLPFGAKVSQGVISDLVRMYDSTAPQYHDQQTCPRAQRHTRTATAHAGAGALVFSSSCLDEGTTRVPVNTHSRSVPGPPARLWHNQ